MALRLVQAGDHAIMRPLMGVACLSTSMCQAKHLIIWPQCLQADNGHAPSSGSAALQPLEDPPSLIADAPGLQIWHKLDRAFKRPIAVAYLCITPRFAYDSARTAALTHLLLKLLQDAVCETAYLADVAGLQYDVRAAFPRRHACSAGCQRLVCRAVSCNPGRCMVHHVLSVQAWLHALLTV